MCALGEAPPCTTTTGGIPVLHHSHWGKPSPAPQPLGKAPPSTKATGGSPAQHHSHWGTSYVYMLMFMEIHIYVCINVCMHACVQYSWCLVSAYIFMGTCVCMCILCVLRVVCVHTCVHVFICLKAREEAVAQAVVIRSPERSPEVVWLDTGL